MERVSWKTMQYWSESRMYQVELLEEMYVGDENVYMKTGCHRVEDKIIGEEEFQMLGESSIWTLKFTGIITGVAVDT